MDSLITKLINEGVILNDMLFTLRSGQESRCYYDIKKAYGNPEIRCELASRIYFMINKKPDFVAASDIGGVPLATTISDNFNLKLTIVRNIPKDHGTKRLVEGYIPSCLEEGIIVDDVFTTGSTLRQSINIIISQTKAKISGCYVVLKRTKDDFEYPLFYLFELEDFNIRK